MYGGGMSVSGPWPPGVGGVSYGIPPQRMSGGVGMNPVIIEEQRRQLALRMRQKQFIQMRRMQQQQQQHSMGPPGGIPPGMAMYGPPHPHAPPMGPHMIPSTGVVAPGMPPSYGQLANMGGGMPPPHSQGLPGGPGPMGM